MTASDALSPKHRLFLDEYRKDRNGAAAAKRAGYSAKRANVTAAELLARDDVKAVLAEIDAGNQNTAGVTEQQIIDELKKLGFSNMLDYIALNDDGDPVVNLSDMTRDQAAAVQEITVQTRTERGGEDKPDAEVKQIRFKLADKRASLVDLGKHLGMFKERVEHTGKDGGPIELRKVHDLTDEQLAAIASAGSSRTAPAPEGEGKPARLRQRRPNPGKTG